MDTTQIRALKALEGHRVGPTVGTTPATWFVAMCTASLLLDIEGVAEVLGVR
jgi:hypothetical protein